MFAYISCINFILQLNQHPGDAIITRAFGAHSGRNLGMNMNLAINFADPDWAKTEAAWQLDPCICRHRNPIRLPITPFLFRHLSATEFNQWVNKKLKVKVHPYLSKSGTFTVPFLDSLGALRMMQQKLPDSEPWMALKNHEGINTHIALLEEVTYCPTIFFVFKIASLMVYVLPLGTERKNESDAER
jgi:hypothetical protein